MNLNFFTKKTVAAPTKEELPQSKLEERSGDTSIQDVIAPPMIEVDFSHLKIGDKFIRTIFVIGYPRYVSSNWLSPLINFNHSLDVAMYIYPTNSKDVLEELRRRTAEMEAEISTDIQRGKIPQAGTQAALEDVKSLQQQIVKGVERFFQSAIYITISAEEKKELDTITEQIQSLLGSLMIISKPASLSMEEAFKTTLPYCQDKLMITRNMDTTALATTFPFVSSEMSDNKGILYGINAHNASLVIFDRFSLENANLLILSTSGGGKSFFAKLEIMRSLMFDVETIIIDPENEYEAICKSVGGNYISFSVSSPHKVNPFEIADPQHSSEDEMGYKYLFLNSLLKIMLGELSPTEDAILNRALVLTYRQKGITDDPSTHGLEPPRMEDLYKALIGMEEETAKNLSARLERFVMGSIKGIFDQQSNIDFNSPITVFTLRELADDIRPIVMFMILDYIWTKIRKDLKKRLLVVDEAWYLMRHEDSAKVLQGFVKRARKYYLGVTIISQNADDFLNSPYGKAIVTNSALQILFKQNPAAIDQVTEVFYLSQGERHMLLSANVGEGLFFAGNNHVAINVVASPEEYALASTKPSDVIAQKEKLDQEKMESNLRLSSDGGQSETQVSSEVKP